MDDNFFLNLFDVSQLKGDRSSPAGRGDRIVALSQIAEVDLEYIKVVDSYIYGNLTDTSVRAVAPRGDSRL
jgi:hypothetical protein